MAFACAGSELGLRLLLSPAGTNAIVRTACVGIGIGFPVYSTFKAVEKKDAAEQEDWLVYWAAYGCFSIAEIFSDKLLSWCPFYYHAKFVFLIWLQFPHNYGARHIYKAFMKPMFLKHKTGLDRIVDTTRNDINKFVISTQESKEFQAVVRTTKSIASSAYETLVGGATGSDGAPNSTRRTQPSAEDWVHVDDGDDDEGSR